MREQPVTRGRPRAEGDEDNPFADEPTKERVWPCLDIAAGAVLLASITAAIVGAAIFLRQLDWI